MVFLDMRLLSCLNVKFCLSTRLVEISFGSIYFPMITFFSTFLIAPPALNFMIWAYLRSASSTNFGILGLPLILVLGKETNLPWDFSNALV